LHETGPPDQRFRPQQLEAIMADDLKNRGA
jgi:hypothetical protein